MKRAVSLALAALLLLSFCACGERTAQDDGGLHIVTTIFPVYDWLQNVVGEARGVEITMLLDSGVDLHSFQPTAQDILRIATCDLFVYVGGESDRWVLDALKETGNPNRVALDLMAELGDLAKTETASEGREADPEEDEEGEEYDEHIWLSLKIAARLTERLGEVLGKLDPAHARGYADNVAAYGAKLRELDARYAQAVAEGQVKTLLFGDRFPFRYLCDDYGLSYYAAFSGCSAETEASFETVAFLAGKADELGLDAILILEGADRRIAQTIVQSTQGKDQRILVMDSLQSVTAGDVGNGATYLSIMEQNLAVLRQALAGKG